MASLIGYQSLPPSRVARVVTLGNKLLPLLGSLKFITFVTMLPKVVTFSLDC